MRRALAATAVAALVVCGAAVAASLPPQLQFDATDQTWAQTLIVSERDLDHTWEIAPGSGEAGDPRDNALCPAPVGPDESDLTITAGNSSSAVRRDGGALVASAATIWQTPEHAQADWDRTNQPSLLGCVAAGLAASSTKKMKLVVTGKRPLAFPAVAPRTAAYRFAIAYKTTRKVRGKRRTISMPATFDLVLLGSGRASAQLIFLSFNKVPIGEASEQRAALSVARRLVRDPKN